jgi:hypothetical protein
VVRLASAGRRGGQGEARGVFARMRAGPRRDYCPSTDRSLNGKVAGQSSKIGSWPGANQGGVGSTRGMGCQRSHERNASNNGDVRLPNKGSGLGGHGGRGRGERIGQSPSRLRIGRMLADGACMYYDQCDMKTCTGRAIKASGSTVREWRGQPLMHVVAVASAGPATSQRPWHGRDARRWHRRSRSEPTCARQRRLAAAATV